MRVYHRLLYGHWVLAGPLLHLLVHLGDLLGVHRPQTAFPLVCPVGARLLNLLEALVEGKIVPDRVLPTIRSRLEVREVFAGKRKS